MRKMDINEASKALKTQLTKAFPGTKFSVRLSRGTGWGNVTVGWTDGPTVAQVDAIAQPWSGKSFDGMTDSATYRRAVVTVGAEQVESPLGYVLTQRELSPERRAELVKAIVARLPHTVAHGYAETIAFTLSNMTTGTPTEFEIVKAAAYHGQTEPRS